MEFLGSLFGKPRRFGAFALSIFLTVALLSSLLASPARASDELELAKSFVRNNPIDVVLDYLERAINDPSSILNSPTQPKPALILHNIMLNPGLLPLHMPKILELAERQIERRTGDADTRANALKEFVRRSIIQNLKADERSIVIAQELSHWQGRRFERDLSNWNRIGEQGRIISSSLLGLVATGRADAAYHARLALFIQMASYREFAAFNLALSTAAAGRRLPQAGQDAFDKLPVFLQSLGSERQFDLRSSLMESNESLMRAMVAFEALTYLHERSYDGQDKSPRPANEVAYKIDLVLKSGSRRFAEEALVKMETLLPRVFNPSVHDFGFAEVMLHPAIHAGLEEALERFPELTERIIAIAGAREELDSKIAEIRLERTRRTNSQARSMVRKVLFRAGTCEAVF